MSASASSPRGFGDLPPIDLSRLTVGELDKALDKIDPAVITKIVGDIKAATAKAETDRQVLAVLLAGAQIALKLLA